MRLALIAVLLVSCGTTNTNIESNQVAFNTSAPGWARAGDQRIDEGHRFVCEGEGASERDAFQSAQSICDDKICKLCGVEIESVVQTRETLTGIQVERKIQERCRRTRKGANQVKRKSVDCGPDGCFAWVSIDYLESQRQTECEQIQSEDFDSPEQCGKLIEDFKNISGYSAASLEERVSVLEQALLACGNIDVRPTPQMQAFGEKLSIGMSSFRKGAPRYLKNHWLKAYEPMWDDYKQSESFVERLRILLAYLRHKIPILHLFEETYAKEAHYDSPEKRDRILKRLAYVPKGEAYGINFPHMLVLSHFRSLARRKRFKTDLNPLNEWFRKNFPPNAMKNSTHTLDLIHLFGMDQKIQGKEWSWIQGLPARLKYRAISQALGTQNHEPRSRKERCLWSIDDHIKTYPGSAPSKALQAIISYRNPDLFLEVEPLLPDVVRKSLNWKTIKKYMPNRNDDKFYSLREDFVPYLDRVLSKQEPDRNYCFGLGDKLEELAQYGVSLGKYESRICECLIGVMTTAGSLSSINKSALYERAVMRRLQCVRAY